MSFRLFGIPIDIEPGFWFTAFLLGLPYLQSSDLSKFAILVWVCIVTVSVLAHELGHAFAAIRFRADPAIALHWMGGTTTWRPGPRLGRMALIVVSLAGPFAGFAVAIAAYAIIAASAQHWAGEPILLTFALHQLVRVNIFWGILNLIPVLPFDGGHVLENALGPRRTKLAAGISTVAGILVALYFLRLGAIWGAFVFAMGAIQSFQRYRLEDSPDFTSLMRRAAREEEARNEPAVPAEMATQLRAAKQALADEELERAAAIATQVLSHIGEPSTMPQAATPALEIIAWIRLMEGDLDRAYAALDQASRIGNPDPALAGAIRLARKEFKEARRVLEAARALGDERKEIVGPLIQVLIAQNDVARAAAVAFDILEALSEDDARQMAQIARDSGVFDWSARLYEAIFQRTRESEDAYQAACAHARSGSAEHALRCLQQAVEAGFSDRNRAWAESSFEALRRAAAFETVLPRP